VPGQGEIVEKKSRFIGEIFPASSLAEAEERLLGIRKRYYDARHHCYAWILGPDGQRRKSSDDGEPSGTAGAPILKVLDGAGVTDALVVVTRYFGGTLLGTGGLVRAYTQAASRALENAGTARMCLCSIFAAELPYSALDKVLYLFGQEGISPDDISYTENVTVMLTLPLGRDEEIRGRILQLSGRTAVFTELDRGFRPVRV
jgi:uncharacterized YigZ family protein